MKNIIELPPEAWRIIIQRARKGDPRCKIALQSRIEKIKSEPGDFHKDGHQGVVVGNLHHEMLGDVYWIQWDGEDYSAKGFEAKYSEGAHFFQTDDDDEDFFAVAVVGARIRQV